MQTQLQLLPGRVQPSLTRATCLSVSVCVCVRARACATLRRLQVSRWLAASPSRAPPSRLPPAEAAARDDATPHQVRPRACSARTPNNPNLTAWKN